MDNSKTAHNPVETIPVVRRERKSAGSSLKDHWPEYLIELWALGTFMFVVGLVVTLFESPKSPIVLVLSNPIVRVDLLALAVGCTLALLIQTPWGKRSGAHMNPAITLAFAFLGKTHPWDAVFYIVAQVFGAILGIWLVVLAMGPLFTQPPVHYAVTIPGPAGELAAFLAETVMSFVLMFTILVFINSQRVSRHTAVAVGLLVTLLIILEAPLSGASMNPARTLASAVPGMLWAHVWLYLAGPPLGMLLAAQIYKHRSKSQMAGCAKMLHPKDVRCIHCGYGCD